MIYYLVVNTLTQDIEGLISTSQVGSILITELQALYEIDESIHQSMQNYRSGSYFDNGIVIPKPPTETPYDHWDYLTKTWITDTNAQLIGETREVRGLRDSLLTTMDTVVSNPLRWADMPIDKQDDWKQYRLDLLNVPQQANYPLDVIWPIAP